MIGGNLLLYIDPGTGSLLVATLVGLISTLIFNLKYFKNRIQGVISGKRIKVDYDFSGQIVLFNEGRNYWNVFSPVINHFIAKQQPIIYLTADENDPGLNLNSPFVSTQFIGEMKQAVHFLARLKASVCVMTTPQLDVVSLKRSKHVLHYSYLQHSCVDIHAYKKFAFDYFDSFMCANAYQKASLRSLEQQRNLPAKTLLDTGCTYLDMYPKYDTTAGHVILVAPTWGDRSFLNQGIDQLIESLLASEFSVLFRPHPQSWISDRDIMQTITQKFDTHPNFTLDKSTDNATALSKAKAVICDSSSGLIFDASLIFKKKVIAVKFDWKDGGYESSDLETISCSEELVKELGQLITPKDFVHIAQLLKEQESVPDHTSIVEKYVYNFRQAAPVAADQIVQLHQKLSVL